MPHYAPSDLVLYCRLMSNKKDARLKLVKDILFSVSCAILFHLFNSHLLLLFIIYLFIYFRVVCITKFFLYRTVYTRGKTLLYCIGLWVTGLLLDLPNWLGWGGHTFGLKEMGCTFDRVKNHSFTIFLATFSIFIPITIVCISYLSVFLFVRHSRATLEKVDGRKHSIRKGKLIDNRASMKSNARNEDLQLAFTLFMTFLAFVVCWSPYMIAIIFDHKDEWPKEVYVFGTLLGHSNSCLNSIIYAMCNKRFRQGYYVFFHKILCRKVKMDGLLKDTRNGFTSLKYTSHINSAKISSSSQFHMGSNYKRVSSDPQFWNIPEDRMDGR